MGSDNLRRPNLAQRQSTAVGGPVSLRSFTGFLKFTDHHMRESYTSLLNKKAIALNRSIIEDPLVKPEA